MAALMTVRDGSSRRRLKQWLNGLAVVLAMADVYGLYKISDPERLVLDEAVRSSVEGRFVRLTDGYTHFDLAGPGDGRPVVLAAGFSVPYYIWDPTFHALAKAGFRVLRYDYFGRGYSDRPDKPYTADFYNRQLQELLAAVRLRPPVSLVGLSLGAAIVADFADAHPDDVKSIVYMDPGFRTPDSGPLIQRLPRLWDFVTVMLDERSWADGQLEDFLHPERFPDWPARYRVQMQFRGFRRARLSELASNANVDQMPVLTRISMHPRPVLVIWGKEDKTVPYSDSTDTMRMLPKARLVTIDEAAHLPQLEQPDAVNLSLIGFLSQ
jgi:pimeloyl-ACP methyl ester carboxylesterase